ncbi:DUF1643 domain-containing protein [Candidatus Poribacteria bacterium]|jgi:hypothetical protein|nr:DUF1643 domain-containing protein [Candidatus Poribacteria bacterium]MBT5533617.1 DUF1643 domain-containing protein [Candidatus Poribacteria bacterium]MBT5714707.1 DUF1643 domain-containing protein [Candidatus Poribacteria bacterium]MBT7099191.1 DUF1643 domain-containing protein [Candidatus Poribacteria bacterium]MBT7806397.1 DUF1643 domain-containing protein [Candidatus Poribacteria bacterium]
MTVGAAVFDETGAYRYRLSRTRSDGAGVVTFVMLNPSTADAEVNDPTIRRCIGFAWDWGHRDLIVVNLFAYRATAPRDLRLATDPVGPANDEHLLAAVCEADVVVAAWGVHGAMLGRDRDVMGLLEGRASLQCLGVTKAGHPRHPLYMPKRSMPAPYAATRESRSGQ